MKANNIKWVIPIITALALDSCTKVIDVNLKDDSSKIVIEGAITNINGPYQVKISKTVKFSASNTFPPVSGAVVKITDNTQSVMDVLTEISPGLYSTQTIQGVPGHSYTLTVIAEEQTYTASSTMPQQVILDSVTFESDTFFGSDEINAVANYQDPAGVNNYYTFTHFINNRRIKGISVFEDRLSDGLYITNEIFSDSADIKMGDTVSLQMNCLDKNAWNYFNTLGDVTGGNNFESVSPANPIGNISNKALGYFSAHTVQTKKGYSTLKIPDIRNNSILL